jgi:hypothetical protein
MLIISRLRCMLTLNIAHASRLRRYPHRTPARDLSAFGVPCSGRRACHAEALAKEGSPAISPVRRSLAHKRITRLSRRHVEPYPLAKGEASVKA